MLRARFVVLVSLVALSVQVALSAAPVDTLLSASDYSESDREMIRELFSRAERLSIPLELLTPRLAEGIAKSIAAERVAAVLAADVERYARARDILREAANGDALFEETGAWSRTATLLSADVPASSLDTIAAAAAAKPPAYRPATELYISLTGWGLEERLSSELAAAALASRIEPQHYPAVVDILTEARRNRMDPERVADELIRSLPDSRSLRTLRQRLGL